MPKIKTHRAAVRRLTAIAIQGVHDPQRRRELDEDDVYLEVVKRLRAAGEDAETLQQDLAELKRKAAGVERDLTTAGPDDPARRPT